MPPISKKGVIFFRYQNRINSIRCSQQSLLRIVKLGNQEIISTNHVSIILSKIQEKSWSYLQTAIAFR